MAGGWSSNFDRFTGVTSTVTRLILSEEGKELSVKDLSDAGRIFLRVKLKEESHRDEDVGECKWERSLAL